MSYDIYLEIWSGKKYVSIEDCSWSHTSNTSCMFIKAFDDENGIKLLHELSCSTATPLLKKAINYFLDNKESLELLNPTNGWGSYTSSLNLLIELHQSASEHPLARFHIWY